MNYICFMELIYNNLIKYVKMQKFNTVLKFVLKCVNYLRISKIGKLGTMYCKAVKNQVYPLILNRPLHIKQTPSY